MNPRKLVESWRNGRASIAADGTIRLAPRGGGTLAGKLRRAYAWISEHAIVAPYQDIVFGEPVTIGPPEAGVDLHPTSYSSYVLLPLLTLVTSQRLLFVGAPGRGKTTMATLMALCAGAPLAEVRRAIVHGHPQLTHSDLLGSPLPSELLRAEQAGDIRVAWRRWISHRVKIIDEYNRIPTKTQSALLSLMAEGYAELYEQVIETGRSAWFLTANDDLGGGTFQVIEALKDRIDAVVRCTPFNARHLDALAARVAEGTGDGAPRGPEAVPADVIFSVAELDQAEREIRAVEVPAEVQDVLGFFAGQLEFCLRASDRLEFRNKDTLHLAGRRVAHVCTEDCPLDKQVHLCAQTENGVSARAFQSILLFAKALAYFRGEPRVSTEDLREVLPWALYDKLRQNPQSAFFQKTEHAVLLVDRATWVRELFERALVQHAAAAGARAPITRLRQEIEAAGGAGAAELRGRLGEIERLLEDVIRRNEMSGTVYDDLVLLKSLHARCRRLLAAAEGRAPGRAS